MTPAPKVFLSYSHDDDNHKGWVLHLANQLVVNGVDVILDQWDLGLGQDLASFMEHSLSGSQRVLAICTDNYNKKANSGIGGVGYEKSILTAELLQNQNTNKFIPLVRGATGNKVPTCLGSRFYIDFSDDSQFQSKLDELLREILDSPKAKKPAIGKNPFAQSNNELPSLNGEISTSFFSERFAHAFPGVRGTSWFKNPHEAVARLNVLLQEPIVFKEDCPVWWWRDGELEIRSYIQVGPTSVLLDGKELEIDELAAVNAGAYHQQFIYVKSKASPPTGLYDYSYIDSAVKEQGYASEGFGMFRGRPIRYEELEDGATVIDGVPIRLNGEGQFRERFLTPYNLIVAPAGSPIGNAKFDQTRREILKMILHGKASLDDFTAAVLRLPKLPHR
ncbi:MULTISPECIES: toll/interleukin-1 receptor domain-containing protein [unclassified Burkholderia]|uniref:toll/interleukin-1 receptor domain-containing protein n=1 Tax=unclassified Burkholderia TaxID=2613784 RepID=UPI002AB2C396|nr:MULTISPECIES: toll/interleukin-1 receptor domain-containing protein [unclassified Burkholderia]